MEWNEQETGRPEAARPRPQRPANAPARRPAQGNGTRPAANGQRRPAPANGARPAANGQRRPAPANGARPAANGQRRPAPANGARPAASGQRQPQRRPAPANGTRSAASGQRQPQRRPAQGSGTRSAAAAQRQPQPRPAQGSRSAATARKRSLSRWRVGMAIYIIVFFLVILWAMHHLWLYLGEFEKSRPEHTIEAYVSHLQSDFYDQMVEQSVGQTALSEYETAESVIRTLNVAGDGSASYSWGKKGDEYTDDAPVYVIRYGDAAIASVALTGEAGTEQLVFPVWRAAEPKTMMELSATPEYSVNVTMPAGSYLTVNGVPVSESAVQTAESPLEIDAAAAALVEQPTALNCSITGLYTVPEVVVSDANGNLLNASVSPAENDKQRNYVFDPADADPADPALISRIEALTRAYADYMVNKDLETWNNLYYLKTFLVPGSEAENMMASLVNDVYWNNDYTSREDKLLEVSHIKMYSDTVCTCEAHFEMILTKTSDRGTIANNYDGTVEWTLVKSGETWNACSMKLLNAGGDSTEN